MKVKTLSIVSLFFVLLMLVSSVSAIYQEGFESGWGEWVSAGVPTRSTTLPRSGDYSIYDAHGESGAVEEDWIYTVWDLSDADDYATVSFWARCVIVTAEEFAPMYRIRFMNSTTWLDWTQLSYNTTNVYYYFEQWSIVLPSTYLGYEIYLDLAFNYTASATYWNGQFSIDDINMDADSYGASSNYISELGYYLVAFLVVLFPAFLIAMAFGKEKLSPITGFLIGITLGVIMGVISGIIPSYVLLSLSLIMLYLIVKGR